MPMFNFVIAESLGFADQSSGFIGINYGQVTNDLPAPTKVVNLLKTQEFTRVKIFYTNPDILMVLADSGITIVVALPNDLFSSVAFDQSYVNTWVEENIDKFYPSTIIDAIAIGNEVFADPNNLTKYIVPAMKNIQSSLIKYNLYFFIKISSPTAFNALKSSYPPLSRSFKPELVEPVIKPMLDIIRQTGSYLMVNIYPFFAYTTNSGQISLDWTLFKENPGVVDSSNGLQYSNLFETQLNAIFATMSTLKYDDVRVVVTKTGWPS